MHTHISGLDRRGHRRDRPLHPAVCWASGSDQLALGVAGLRRLEDATDSVAGGAVDPSCGGCALRFHFLRLVLSHSVKNL